MEDDNGVTNSTSQLVEVGENNKPTIISLQPDKSSPQKVGAIINWIANASDTENDQMLYRFFLDDNLVNDWSNSPSWSWSTSAKDAGSNQIKAQVRDGMHASEDGFDGELSVYFTLSEPARSISGNAFEDKNGNGWMDDSEALVSWMVQLVKPDKSQASTITREDGSYKFEQLEPETYTVSIELPSGWRSISPESGSYSVDLREGDAKDRHFVNRLVSYNIEGMMFSDLNSNGVNDGEPGMEGWTIQLSKDGHVVNSTITGMDGTWFKDEMHAGFRMRLRTWTTSDPSAVMATQ